MTRRGWALVLAYLFACGWVIYLTLTGYTPGSLLERLCG